MKKCKIKLIFAMSFWYNLLLEWLHSSSKTYILNIHLLVPKWSSELSVSITITSITQPFYHWHRHILFLRWDFWQVFNKFLIRQKVFRNLISARLRCENSEAHNLCVFISCLQCTKLSCNCKQVFNHKLLDIRVIHQCHYTNKLCNK